MNKRYKIHEVICTIGNFGKDIVTEPLIRCKNCKWWEPTGDGSEGKCSYPIQGFVHVDWRFDEMLWLYRVTKSHYFCGDGERKDDGGEKNVG